MYIPITDPMAGLLGVAVESVLPDGIVTRSQVRPDFCNTYSLTHGGYLYALGHITAALSAKLCLGRSAVVVDVTSQYLQPLRTSPARGESQLLRSGRELMVWRVRILDGDGVECLRQTVLLKEVDFPAAAEPVFPVTIHPAAPEAAVDPVTGVAYPRLSTFFGGVCHAHILGRGADGMVYGADLYPDTTNLYGAAHGGMIYTCCDCAAGGSAAFLLGRQAVTVSSTIRYLRSITTGPVRAEVHLVRQGGTLLFYDVDVTDGNGVLSATAQFVLRTMPSPGGKA